MRLIFCLLLMLCPVVAFANENVTTVTQSIEYTLKNNPLLQAALSGKESAINEIEQAKSGYLPTVDVWAAAGFAQEQNQVDRDRDLFSDPVLRMQIGLNLNQNIYAGGSTQAAVNSRTNNLEAYNNTVLDTANNLVLETIIAHSNVVTYAELLEVSRNNYTSHQNLVTLLEERHKKGVIARGDFEQGYGKLKKAEISLLSSIEAYDLARLNYKKLTGVYPAGKLQPLYLPAVQYKEVKDVLDKAVENNYKMQELLYQVDSFENDLEIADAGYLPSVDFAFNPSYTTKDVDDNENILAWEADINVSWNVFRGFADEATINMSKAQIRKGQENLKDVKDAISLQIGTAYQQAVTAQKQLILFEAANVANLNAKKNFYNQFRVGQKEVLQLLDIEREVHTTQAEYLLAEANLRISHYRLHALAGTLLDEMKVSSQNISESKTNPDSTQALSF